MYNRKAFKREAKERMRESTPHFMLVLLVYVLLTTGLSCVGTVLSDTGGLLDGVIGIFLEVFIALFSMVMSVGLANYTLNLSRGKSTAMGDLFEGFSFAGRSIGVNLLTAIYTLLWTLLGAVGVGIIVALAVLLAESAPALMVTLFVLAYIAMAVFVVAISLRYAMAGFALAENPEDGAAAAVRRSVRMMKGNKGRLFVLQLSFLGWGLLCAVIVLAVLGIGVLITGLDWFAAMISSMSGDPVNAYSLVMEMVGSLTLWTVIAEVVCLPLTLWLTAYQQTAYARFYNFVCGYDDCRPAEGDCREENALPECTSADHPVPPAPPGGFYTPAPSLDEGPAEGTDGAPEQTEAAPEDEDGEDCALSDEED